MIRTLGSEYSLPMCIPRESGDDPIGHGIQAIEEWYSPRERG